MKRMLVLFSLVAIHLTFCGTAVEASGDPRAAELTYAPWVKVCLKQADGSSQCFVGSEARGACDPSGGGLAIVTDEKNVSLSVTLRTKRMPEGAISIQIDQGKTFLIPHPECNGLLCYGRAPIDGNFIERLKQSKTITIQAMDTTHQEIGFSLFLDDFARAYDGPASEPKVFEETADKMKGWLKQAEERKPPECNE
jgi:invasion protein IalB